MLLFSAFGVALVRMHDCSSTVTKLKLLSTVIDLAVQGNIVIAEIFYVVVLLQANSELFEILAIIVIIARLQNALAGAYLLHRFYAPKVPQDSVTTNYYDLLDKDAFLAHAELHSMLQVLMIFDVTQFRYFAWQMTSVTTHSLGFPDSLSFTLCMASRLLQCSVALIAQIIVLNQIHTSSINSEYTVGLMVLVIAMTVIVLLTTVTAVCMHNREESDNGGEERVGTCGDAMMLSFNPLSNSSTHNGKNRELDLLGSASNNGRSSNSTTGGGMNAADKAQWEERVALLEGEVNGLRSAQAEQLKQQENRIEGLALEMQRLRDIVQKTQF